MSLVKILCFLSLSASLNSLADESQRLNDLGRLFFTPEQREQLNLQRLNSEKPTPAAEPAPEQTTVKLPPPPPEPPASIQFNGIYLKPKPIIWLNQQTAPWPLGIQQVRYHKQTKSVEIQCENGTNIQLKVGETWRK